MSDEQDREREQQPLDAAPVEGEEARAEGMSAAERLRRSAGRSEDAAPAPKKKHSRWRNLLIAGGAAVVVVAAALTAVLLWPEPAAEGEDTGDAKPSILEMANDAFDRVKITNESGTYTVAAKGDEYEIVERPDITVNASSGRDLRSMCTSLSAESLIEENAADLTPYGLDTPRATAEITYTDGSTQKLLLGDALVSGQGSYLMRDGDPNVYTVWINIGNNLVRTPGELRLASLTMPTAEDVRYIKLQREGQSDIELTYDEGSRLVLGSWDLAEPPVEADDSKVGEFLESACALTLGSYKAEATNLADYGLDTPRTVLTMRDAENNEVRIQIGDDDGEYYCYARIDDSNFVYQMSKSALAFLDDVTTTKMVYQFANIFNIQKVDKIVLTYPGGENTLTIKRTPSYDDKGERNKDAAGNPMYDETFFLDGKEVTDKGFRTFYQLIIGTVVDGTVKKEATGTPVLSVAYTFNNGLAPSTIDYLPYDSDNYAVRRDGKVYFFIHKEKVDTIVQHIEPLRNGELDEGMPQ